MSKTDREKLRAERDRIKQARKKREAELAQEQVIRCRFQNLEMPGVDLQFTYEGHRYHLLDGVEYDLPVSVVNHLNSLTVPVYKQYDAAEVNQSFRPDPARPEERIGGRRNRFSLIPMSITSPGGPPAKKEAGKKAA